MKQDVYKRQVFRDYEVILAAGDREEVEQILNVRLALLGVALAAGGVL